MIYCIIKGGSWSGQLQYCYTSFCYTFDPFNGYNFLGFRLTKTLKS